jgi:hypothetical protein
LRRRAVHNRAVLIRRKGKMISDVLSDALEEINSYISDPIFADTYEGLMRQDIEALRAHMEIVLRRLDTPPGLDEE